MLQPIGNRILVKPFTKEQTTKGGIVLPDSAQEKPQTGEVVAVGQGKMMGDTIISFEEMGVKKGVTVMFKDFGPIEIKMGSVDYLVIEAKDILGIVTK